MINNLKTIAYTFERNLNLKLQQQGPNLTRNSSSPINLHLFNKKKFKDQNSPNEGPKRNVH